MADNQGKKRIGIIGYGGFGAFIHAAWDRMDNARVVAICDADPARNPGGVAFYSDIPSLLADPEVDIVSIATPPSSHKDVAIQAMRAGKHALIEKPLALTEEDALLIKQVAQETGRIATVNFVLRYNPVVEMLRQIVQAGVLGAIRRVDLRNYATQETVPEGHWFWEPSVSGRILVEHGVHFFDLASWAMNSKATKEWSMGVERKPGMEDRVLAVVNYENDVVGTYWHSFTRPKPLETTTFHFAFDLGEIEMVGWIPLKLSIWGWTDQRGLDLTKTLFGEANMKAEHMTPAKQNSGGIEYEVEYEVNAAIELQEPKLQVYADGLRAIMADLIQAIDSPSHVMRVTLDDAIEAVRVAEKATKVAHPEG